MKDNKIGELLSQHPKPWLIIRNKGRTGPYANIIDKHNRVVFQVGSYDVAIEGIVEMVNTFEELEKK